MRQYLFKDIKENQYNRKIVQRFVPIEGAFSLQTELFFRGASAFRREFPEIRFSLPDNFLKVCERY